MSAAGSGSPDTSALIGNQNGSGLHVPTAPRFGSLAELLGAHAKLIREVGRNLLTAENLEAVGEFVRRVVATGAILEAREDRTAAQDVIGFWTARVATAARERARAERKAGLSTAAEPAVVPDFGETLLVCYNPDAGKAAAETADRALGGLSEEDRALARRIVLRLVRLRPDATTSDDLPFDPVPTTRGTLDDLGDAADVERLVQALTGAGVLRIVPGDSPAAAQVTLAATTLMRDWPALKDWMLHRRDMRRRAAEYVKDREARGREPSRGMRLRAVAIRWLSRFHRWVGLQITRLRWRTPAATGLLRRDELAEVQGYHDRNAAEQQLLNDSRLWEEKTGEANRTLLGVATLAAATALVFVLLTALSARKAWLAVENANTAEKAATEAAHRATGAEKEARKAEAEARTAEGEARKAEAKADVTLKQMFASRFVHFGEEEGVGAEIKLWAAQRAVRALRSAGLDPKADPGVVRLCEKGLSPQNPRVSLPTGHRGAIRALAFSGDGQKLVTGGDDRTARLWNVQTRQLLKSFDDPKSGHTDRVLDVAFSPDGQYVATASADHRAIVWGISSGRVRPLAGHKQPVVAVTFGADGKWVATVGRDGTPLLWDAEKGVGLRALVPQEAQAVAGEGEFDPPLYASYAVAFNAAGTRLAVVRWDGNVRLWDARSGEAVPLPAQGGGAPTFGALSAPAVAFLPDGRLALGAGREARILNVEDAKSAAPVELPTDGGVRQWLGPFVLTPGGRLAAPASAFDGSVRALYWRDGAPAGTTWLPRSYDPPTAGALAPDGGLLAVARQSPPFAGPAAPRPEVWVEIFDARPAADPVAKVEARESNFGPPLAAYEALLRSFAPHYEAPLKRARALVLRGDDSRAQEEIRAGLALPGLAPDAEKEAARLTGELVWARGVGFAQESNVGAATAAFQRAGEFDPTRPKDARREAEKLAAQSLAIQAADEASRAVLSKGDEFTVDQGQLSAAVKRFHRARELDPQLLPRDAQTEARAAVARTLVGRGHFQIRNGRVAGALSAYRLAGQYDDPKMPALDARAWNELCWWGSLWKAADKVLFAGEKAVKMAPENLGIRDTRGLARALTGDTKGAIEDFDAYANSPGAPPELVKKRKQWIEILRKGEPFPESVLDELRVEGEPIMGPPS